MLTNSTALLPVVPPIIIMTQIPPTPECCYLYFCIYWIIIDLFVCVISFVWRAKSNTTHLNWTTLHTGSNIINEVSKEEVSVKVDKSPEKPLGLKGFHNRHHRPVCGFSPIVSNNVFYSFRGDCFHRTISCLCSDSQFCNKQTLNIYAYIGQALIGSTSVLKIDFTVSSSPSCLLSPAIVFFLGFPFHPSLSLLSPSSV